ncbi:MAG: TRAP transporter large permease [Oscillospiraceae bacterium]|nr:TRAP transporter large permease [Oscillospiraceae bacterium]
MSGQMIGLLGTLLVIVLMFLRVPVAFSMLTVAYFGMVVMVGFKPALSAIGTDLYTNFSSYTMSVIPLFGLMGYLASYSGLGSKLFNLGDKAVGHVKGGLCMAVQIACAIFGAICGSNSATVATIGSIAYPEMKKLGYQDSLSTASVASGASLSLLIPPSVTFIVYGIATEVSIGKLFISGILPGILLMVLFMIVGYVSVAMNPSLAPIKAKASRKERLAALTDGGVLEVLIVFFVSIGGIFFGWFTATEAGAIGATGMLLVCLFSKKLTWHVFKKSLLESAKLTATVFLLVASATVFSRFFALSRIPTFLGDLVASLDVNKWVIFAIILFIYLILGMFIDALAMILLTIPVFYPIIVTGLGYDPIWFGVLIVMVLSMASITPPIGLNVFVMQSVTKDVPIFTIYKGVWGYVAAIVVACGLLIAFPSIATFLPSLV